MPSPAAAPRSADGEREKYRSRISCVYLLMRAAVLRQSGAPITAIPKVDENDSTSPTSSTAHGRNSIMSATAEASEVGICPDLPPILALLAIISISAERRTDEEKPVSAANSSANTAVTIIEGAFGTCRRRSRNETTAVIIPRCRPLTATMCDIPSAEKSSDILSPSSLRSPSSSARQSPAPSPSRSDSV